MMGIVHVGSPLSTIADVLLQNISLRNVRLDTLSQKKKDWICRLLYKGKCFYLSLEENRLFFHIGYLAVKCLERNIEMNFDANQNILCHPEVELLFLLST